MNSARLAVLVCAAGMEAWAQTVCPPLPVQTAYAGTLSYTSSSRTVLLHEADGSYTAFELSTSSPYSILGTTPNYQNVLLTCPSPTPPLGGSDSEAFVKLKSGGYLFVEQSPELVYLPNGGAEKLYGGSLNVQQFDAKLTLVAANQCALPFPTFNIGVGSITLVDLNGDGNPDIVETIGGVHSDNDYAYVIVLLGAGGANFGTPVAYPVGGNSDTANAVSAAIADFNGDGKLDLAVSTDAFPGPTLSILLGIGDGTFQAEQIISQAACGAQIAAGDFNRDGHADVACTGTNGSVFVFLGNGNGTFGAPAQYPVATVSGPRQSAILTADIDGDGNPDIVTSGVSILFSDGKGGFPRRREVLVETNGNLILADFNHDGIPDLVTANGNADVLGGQSIAVLLGTGGGQFSGPPVTSGVTASPLGELGANAVADFNGDGIPDIASVTEVYFGVGDGTFGAGTALALPMGCNASTVITADFNSDGKPDIAVICGGNQATQTIEVFLNGGGKFGQPVATTVNFPAPSGLSAGPKPFISADFNGDGKPDVALLTITNPPANPSPQTDLVFVLAGNGDGTFGTPKTFSAGAWPWTMAAGDFNGDGKLDLLVAAVGQTAHNAAPALSVFPGNGDDTFGAAMSVPLPPGLAPYDVAAADFNGDGNLDAAVYLADGGTGVYFGQGNGTFQPPVLYANAYGNLATGDLNGDGVPDIIAGAGYLLGLGDGSFEPYMSLGNGLYSFNLIPADYNHDGKLDLGASVGGSRFAVFLNSGHLSAGPPLEVMSSASLTPGPVAPASFATIFGRNLAASTSDTSASVSVQDVAGTSRATSLLYVSPEQINFLVPAGTVSGLATVTVSSGKGVQSTGVQVRPVAPALFTLNNSGLAAAYMVRVTATGQQIPEPVYTVENGAVVPAPINQGAATDQLYLVLYGTGISGAPAGSVIPTHLGNVTYSGPQTQVPGLDQVNLLLFTPVSAGELDLALMVDGVYTNTVKLIFQ